MRDPDPSPVYPKVREREFGLDWLRVFAFAILILYHTGMFFVPWTWHVKNPEQSTSLTWVMVFVSKWRLPLLFFISGAGVFFSLRRRTYGEFAVERLRRLLLPLAFGMFVVVPPQIYFERLRQGVSYDSYLAFWKTVFDFVSYPQGSLSWHHLWFVAYILVYSLIMIPVFVLLRGRAGAGLTDRLRRLCEKPGAIWLIGVPNIAVALWLGPRWPVTHNLVADWANFTGSLLTFLWGFILCGNRAFLDLIQRRRREFLIVALAMTAVFYGVRISGIARGWTPAQRLWTGVLIDSYFGMAWLMTLVAYSRALLNRDSKALRYATEAVYPFYIAHQTITVAIAYFMIDWNAAIAVKLPLLAIGTFAGSWLVFEAAKRTNVTRMLMGMRARPARAPAPGNAETAVAS